MKKLKRISVLLLAVTALGAVTVLGGQSRMSGGHPLLQHRI